MKKVISITLDDEDVQALLATIQDRDKDEALRFILKHVKPRLRQSLEGACRPSDLLHGGGRV